MPRVTVLQGQVQTTRLCRRCIVLTAPPPPLPPLLLLLPLQARSVLGVSFFGCSHLHQGGGAGDSLCCPPLAGNSNRHLVLMYSIRYSKIAAPCTAASIPPGIDVLVCASLIFQRYFGYFCFR
jgi:hypothetical protein